MKHVLQIKAALLQNGVDITKWDNSYYKVGQAIHYEKWVNNYKVGKYYKVGQPYYKMGKVLQSVLITCFFL